MYITVMPDSDLSGRLVFLTVHMDMWLRRVNTNFNIPMANRLAKVVKVFDWDTEEGKLLLEEREKNGKWKELNPKDFKFILKIYYPELYLPHRERQGTSVQEVVPRHYPGTEKMLFDVLPDWLLIDLQKEEKNILQIERKMASLKKDVPKRFYRKSK